MSGFMRKKRELENVSRQTGIPERPPLSERNPTERNVNIPDTPPLNMNEEIKQERPQQIPRQQRPTPPPYYPPIPNKQQEQHIERPVETERQFERPMPPFQSERFQEERREPLKTYIVTVNDVNNDELGERVIIKAENVTIALMKFSQVYHGVCTEVTSMGLYIEEVDYIE
jgi:hypothetical protein